MSQPDASVSDRLPPQEVSKPKTSAWGRLPPEGRVMVFKEVAKDCPINIDSRMDDMAKKVDDPIKQEQLERPITHAFAQVDRQIRGEFSVVYQSDVTLQATIYDLDHSKLIHYLSRSKHACPGKKPQTNLGDMPAGPSEEHREVVVNPPSETVQVTCKPRPIRNLHIRLCLGEMMAFPGGTNLTPGDLGVRAFNFSNYFVESGVAEIEGSLYSVTYECEPLLGIFRDILLEALKIGWQFRERERQGDCLGLHSLMLMTRAVRNCEQIDGRKMTVAVGRGKALAFSNAGSDESAIVERGQDDTTSTVDGSEDGVPGHRQQNTNSSSSAATAEMGSRPIYSVHVSLNPLARDFFPRN